MNLHVYSAPMQPATRWEDCHSEPPFVFVWPAHRLLWCDCCGKRRHAKNVVVQSYYDQLMKWCAPGKGCKALKVIADKATRAFKRRSDGQKRRYGNV